jgi:hypothetical protein
VISLYRHYIVINVTGKHKGNHEPTLQLLKGPFIGLKEAKQRLTEMNSKKAFVAEGRKILEEH